MLLFKLLQKHEKLLETKALNVALYYSMENFGVFDGLTHLLVCEDS